MRFSIYQTFFILSLVSVVVLATSSSESTSKIPSTTIHSSSSTPLYPSVPSSALTSATALTSGSASIDSDASLSQAEAPNATGLDSGAAAVVVNGVVAVMMLPLALYLGNAI